MPENNTFTRDCRIIDAPAYRWTMGKRKLLYGKYFTMYYRQHTLGYGRFGIIVSKANVKHAVDRNLIKRISREWFRLNKGELTSHSLVFVAKKSANTATRTELVTCLEKLAQKLNSLPLS